MTITATESEAVDVMFMTKGNWLLARDVDFCCIACSVNCGGNPRDGRYHDDEDNNART